MHEPLSDRWPGAAFAPAQGDSPELVEPNPATASPATGNDQQPSGQETWTPEGLAGTAENQIDARAAQRFAMAFGTAVARELGAGVPPRIAIGGDGRWLSARLVAAASRGCQLAGCQAVEIGGATAGSLAMVIGGHGLDGGILIGNALSAPETVSLKCWGPAGRPWSAGGGLELVREALTSEAIRSSRRSAGLERLDPTDEYRQRLAELFHSLRPLRLGARHRQSPLERAFAAAGRTQCLRNPVARRAGGRWHCNRHGRWQSRQAAANGWPPQTASPLGKRAAH